MELVNIVVQIKVMPGLKILKISVLFFTTMLFSGVLQSQPAGVFKSFDIQPGANRTVMIQWEISAEADTLRMEVERSSDQKIWERIWDVSVMPSHRYFVTDTIPREGLNYYRVLQAGILQQFINPVVKWVQVSKTGNLYIWPNPAFDMLNIKTPFTNGRIDILDSGGKLIFNINITALVTEVPIDRLSKGIYYIHVIHGNEVLTQRFLKQ